ADHGHRDRAVIVVGHGSSSGWGGCGWSDAGSRDAVTWSLVRADVDAGGERGGQPPRQCAHVLEADAGDLVQGLIHARVLAVDELDGAEPAHAAGGVLQAEGEGPGDLSLGALQLLLGDALASH